MVNKSTLEEEMRTMVALVKDLQAKVERFEVKGEPRDCRKAKTHRQSNC